MSKWKEYRLSDLMEIIGGGTPKTTISEYWGGDIPWLSVTDFNNGRKYCYDTEKKITERGLKESSTKILKKGQVIISARGTVGVVSMLGRDMAFNQSNYGIEANEKLTNNEYLYYLLKHNIPNFISNSYGAVFDTITKDTFDQITVNIPEGPEQRSIISMLSGLDDKIDLLHRQNKTLEQLAETLFRQWFIEEAEEEWTSGKLGNYISVKGGTTPSTSIPEYWNGDIHWATPRDLSNHESVYIFNTERLITSKGLSEIGSGLLPQGTVLLSSRAPIGYLVITEIPLAINQGYIAIVCDKNISNYFIYLWIKSNMDMIKGAANGSVFPEISKTVFKDLDFIVPPKTKLSSFNTMIKPYFEKIRVNQIQIRTLTQLRDSLLPKLISGEIKVSL
jgi:type I restriction enzyme, S subunit